MQGWNPSASHYVLFPPLLSSFPSSFQVQACSQSCLSCRLWFSGSSPEWRPLSRRHRTQPHDSSCQSSESRPRTRCPHPCREQQRHCQRRRSRCLPDTWTSRHRRCAHSGWAAPPQGSSVSSFRALCCLRSTSHTFLGQPPAA
uniref:Uncharacterized protein n=1 Tax=Catagonus wagneri TaxID=51154 RepID=A0A8C3VL93_9CETA